MTLDGEWLEEIEHTGDTGLRWCADSPEHLFERGGWAMFYQISSAIGTIKARHSFEIELEAEEISKLLVCWLNELNFLFETKYILLSHFEVERLTETGLTAVVKGDYPDLSGELVENEIKAVTFHNLYVKQIDSKWYAQIVLDL